MPLSLLLVLFMCGFFAGQVELTFHSIPLLFGFLAQEHFHKDCQRNPVLGVLKGRMRKPVQQCDTQFRQSLDSESVSVCVCVREYVNMAGRCVRIFQCIWCENWCCLTLSYAGVSLFQYSSDFDSKFQFQFIPPPFPLEAEATLVMKSKIASHLAMLFAKLTHRPNA